MIRVALVRMDFLRYIMCILHFYFGNRNLYVCCDTQGIPITLRLSCGAPKESVIGLLLWNITLDAVIRLPMSTGAITIGFGIDTLIVAKDDTVDEVEGHSITVLCAVTECICGLGLDLVVEKTHAVMFTRRQRVAALTIVLEGNQFLLSLSLKYVLPSLTRGY